ncbi:MAG: D-lactate dehydrogenase [Pseudomonadota bacterium]|nr:D-lactate dehydrogenase [Pseudomonadota bacterium]
MLKFHQELKKYINSKRIIDDPLLCYAYGTDASLYRLTPKLVIQVENNQEIIQLLSLANQYKVSLTFRAAGTSLSGQAITDQVLVILSNTSWQKYSIINNGSQITLEPGIIGATANLFLKPYQTKIGPDPASINVCKIGGIVANNSSGMCCGINNNTYQTMSGIKIILANGTVLDTRNSISRNQFINNNQAIIDGINLIKQQILTNSQLITLISHKFKIKNTSGYSLNSFLDFTDPIDILAHLMVGSEGTLGFISEISYNCVKDNPYKAITLIYYHELTHLIETTLEFTNDKALNIDAIELLDITSLNSIKNITTAKPYLPKLTHDTSAMLIEISAASQTELEVKINRLQQIVDKHPPSFQIKFTQDSKIYTELWNLRKEILPTIGSSRSSNTGLVLEDIAVPIINLPDLIHDLRQLFTRFAYTNAAIFGHILSGNIHFVFTPVFDTQADIDNYKFFMDNLSHLIVNKYHGSLKAEHGCGRNMAPFIQLEWGDQLHAIMWQIKNLLDPNNILNPDVKLTTNPNLHIQNLKRLNLVHPKIDKCIECGLCEAVCPSKNLTLTPRQRIATYRKLVEVETTLKPQTKSEQKQFKQLLQNYRRTYNYYAIETCATTGLCQNKCPVGINTGEFILSLKSNNSQSVRENYPKEALQKKYPSGKNYIKNISILKNISLTNATLREKYWLRHFDNFVKFNHFLLNIGNWAAKFLSRNQVYTISKKLNQSIPVIPVFLPTLPQAQTAQFKFNAPTLTLSGAATIPSSTMPIPAKTIIYFPSCNNRVLADTTATSNSPVNSLQKLLNYLEYNIIYPDNLANLCCGQVFNSWGNNVLGREKSQELAAALSKLNYPVITDNSSCLASLLQQQYTLNLMDSTELIYLHLDKLPIKQKYEKLALHIDCSTQKLGSQSKIMQIVSKCSRDIIIPRNIACCGFAGNKGLTRPELNSAALFGLEEEISKCDIGVTFNRNCQIGLSFYGNKTYLSLPELILNCLRA